MRLFLFFPFITFFLASSIVFGQFQLQLSVHPRYVDVTKIEVFPYESGQLLRVTSGEHIDSAYINQKAKEDLMDLFANNMLRTDTTHSILNVWTKGYYQNEGFQREFEFNKPNPKDPEHRLIAILWSIMYAVIDDNNVISTLELTEAQFDFGIGIKVIKDDPLTYKLYGNITGKDSEQFYNFIDQLPDNDTIYFDMENFLSMGRVYYPAISDLMQSNPNIYWYNCSNKTKTHLMNCGVIYGHIELKEM